MFISEIEKKKKERRRKVEKGVEGEEGEKDVYTQMYRWKGAFKNILAAVSSGFGIERKFI